MIAVIVTIEALIRKLHPESKIRLTQPEIRGRGRAQQVH
jgi:hypothetical protein